MMLSNDVLSAYLDGALAPAEMTRVASALESDADARARLAAFRRVQFLVREVDRVAGTNDAPAHLAAAIRAAPIGPRSPADWLARVRSAVGGIFALPRPALAGLAVAVVVIGIAAFGAGRLSTTAPSSSALLAAASEARPGSALHAALETLRMGGGIDTEVGHITVVATFRDRDRRYCREYDYGAAEPGAESVTGIACRAGGGWRVEVAVLEQNTAVADGYVPASAQAHRAVEAFVQERTVGAPLSVADEQRAIANGWDRE